MSHRRVILLVLSCFLFCSCLLSAEAENAVGTVQQTILGLRADLKAVGDAVDRLAPLPLAQKRAARAMTRWNHLRRQAAALTAAESDRFGSELQVLDQQMGTVRNLLGFPDSPRVPAPAGTDGAISGWITDFKSGSAISDIRLVAYDTCGRWAGYDYTDSNGKYVIPGLPEGTYYVLTSSWGDYVDELYDNISCWDGCNPTDGTPITVSSGGITNNINFQLRHTGSISGTVLGVGMLPISWYYVRVYDSKGNVQYGDPGPDGVYHVQGLRSGNHYVVTNAYQYRNEIYDNLPCPDPWSCDPLTGTPVPVSLGEDTPGIDFQLQEFGSIEGKVTDAATGQPLVGIWINIYDSNGWYEGYGQTDNRGKYLTEGIPDGIYYVRTYNWMGYNDQLYRGIDCSGGCDVTQGRPVEVRLGQKTRKVHFALSR